jgi:hypothetical protein
MDENEYRHAYNSINEQRCVFEKSILTLNCQCRFHEKFNLAEREGIRCSHPEGQTNCKIFLDNSRAKARFALQLTDIVGNLLPHSKEIQVQKGALLGLQPDLPNLPATAIPDIYALIETALDESNGELQNYPYQKIIASITHHPARQRLRRKKREH